MDRGQRNSGGATGQQDGKERPVGRPDPGADRKAHRNGNQEGYNERESSSDRGIADHWRANLDLAARLEHQHREPERGEDREGLGAGIDQVQPGLTQDDPPDQLAHQHRHPEMLATGQQRA
jgi:hypothetical protein